MRMPSMGGATAKSCWVSLPGCWAAERVGSRLPYAPHRENKQEAGIEEGKKGLSQWAKCLSAWVARLREEAANPSPTRNRIE